MTGCDPRDELHIDLASPKAWRVIADSRERFAAFADEHRFSLDLTSAESIEAVFRAAKEQGVFAAAHGVRRLFFGDDMHFYGVSYFWDHCIERCTYCPAAITNRAHLYAPRELSVEESVRDVRAVMMDGHTHLCILTGESPYAHPTARLARHLAAIDQLGLDEIILNIDPKTTQEFRKLRNAVTNTPLQFRVFQETYDRAAYASVHPHSAGRKPDYDFRRQSQARALEAGFDNVGLGVLFGLHRYPLEELEGLQEHLDEIEKEYGVLPARVCLPSAGFLDRVGVSIPYPVPKGSYTPSGEILRDGPHEFLSEVVYALAKLAMPQANLVSSERDPNGLLKRLDRYASCTTLNVHPGVGDNLVPVASDLEEEVHFEQAVCFSRDPAETIRTMRERGFRPILSVPKVRHPHA